MGGLWECAEDQIIRRRSLILICWGSDINMTVRIWSLWLIIKYYVVLLMSFVPLSLITCTVQWQLQLVIQADPWPVSPCQHSRRSSVKRGDEIHTLVYWHCRWLGEDEMASFSFAVLFSSTESPSSLEEVKSWSKFDFISICMCVCWDFRLKRCSGFWIFFFF